MTTHHASCRHQQHRGRRTLAASVCLVLALTGALVSSAASATTSGTGNRSTASSSSASPAAARAGSGTTVRRVVVQWKGAHAKRREQRTVGVPGIGRLTITCRPNQTQISLYAADRTRETQMWMAKYQDKSYGRSVAVKTVRIYKYANADDDGHGGTGDPQHEGLNLTSGKDGVENYGKGYAYGLISQRPGRNRPAGGVHVAPSTAFDVDWYWNGFDYPPRYRSCKIAATFVTDNRSNIHLDWHGNDDATGHVYQQTTVPGLGKLDLRCEPGRYGRDLVSLEPVDPKAKAYVETIQGEGRVEDQVSTRNATVDQDTGKLGPFPLPRNGMMRFFFDKDGTGKHKVAFLLSAYQITNNPHANLDLCEVAMSPFPG